MKYMCTTGCDYYSCFPICSIRTIVIICIIGAFLCYSRNRLYTNFFWTSRILTFSIIKFITIAYINVTNNRLNIAGQNCCISKHIFSHILRICNLISVFKLFSRNCKRSSIVSFYSYNGIIRNWDIHTRNILNNGTIDI